MCAKVKHLFLQCACGEIESNQHYFFDCRYYREIRNSLFQSVSEISTVSLHTPYFGDETLSLADNGKYFRLFTHTYLTLTVLGVESPFDSLFLLLKSHATLKYKVFCLKNLYYLNISIC